MKGFLSTILIFTFVLVAIVGASGDAAAMADAKDTAVMIIGTIVNTCIVMAQAFVEVLGGIGADAPAATTEGGG